MKADLIIHVDGACSGNPGPAGIGVAIDDQNGQRLKEISQFIGSATNNIAEYTALIFALQEALLLKAKRVKIFTDSELVHKQVTGQYKVKHEKMKPLFEQVKHLWEGFEQIEFFHVLREKNKDADKLATQAIKKQVNVVASPS